MEDTASEASRRIVEETISNEKGGATRLNTTEEGTGLRGGVGDNWIRRAGKVYFREEKEGRQTYDY